MPTLCPLFALDETPPPMTAAAAAACCTDDAFERCLQAGRCLALTALALLRDPKLAQKASELTPQRALNDANLSQRWLAQVVLR